MITYNQKTGALAPIKTVDRDWALFYLFGLVELGADPVGFDSHIDWVRGRPFESPDEWLGPEGDRFRARWGNVRKNPSAEFVHRWRTFRTAHERTPLKEINRLLALFLHDV